MWMKRDDVIHGIISERSWYICLRPVLGSKRTSPPSQPSSVAHTEPSGAAAIAGPVILSRWPLTVSSSTMGTGICSISPVAAPTRTTDDDGQRSCTAQQSHVLGSIAIIGGDGRVSYSVPPKVAVSFGSYFAGSRRHRANPSSSASSTLPPPSPPVPASAPSAAAAAAAIRSLIASGLQQIRVIAAASEPVDEPCMPGWHGTDPLSATQMWPDLGHSTMQCGPPTRSTVPSARVISCGTRIICRTPIVAASSSTSVFENCSVSHRHPGLAGEREML